MNDLEVLLRELLESIKQPAFSKAEEDAEVHGEWIDINDWAGGNYDDAYLIGVDVGRYELAYEILELLNK